MTSRPRTRVAAVLLISSLLLAGCSGASSGAPQVEGEFAESASMTFPEAQAPAELGVEVIEEGDGKEVGADDFVLAHYVGQVWQGDVFDSSFDRGAPALFSLNGVIQGWKEGLTGVQEGSRVVISIPPELGYGPEGNEAAGIQGTDTLTFTVDVLGAWAPDAAGDPEAEPTGNEAPVEVQGALGEPASIVIPEGAPEPTEGIETIVLAESDGPPVPAVEDGTMVVLQYAAAPWGGGQSESTWEMNGPIDVTLGGTVFDGLAGLPVGSRAVVLVPGVSDPSSGQDVPAMAAVVDILGTAGVDLEEQQRLQQQQLQQQMEQLQQQGGAVPGTESEGAAEGEESTGQ